MSTGKATSASSTATIARDVQDVFVYGQSTSGLGKGRRYSCYISNATAADRETACRSVVYSDCWLNI